MFRGLFGREPKHLNVEKVLHNGHFRVAVFGSARIEPKNEVYQQVYDLSKQMGMRGFDIITGGGPGLMEAANSGHMAGDKGNKANSIGLVIHLPFENKGNDHLEIQHKYRHFSKRLDTFLQLSHAMVVFTGGIGSLLELYYMWQHLQVHHVEYKPIILVGKMWMDLIEWMKKDVLSSNLVSPEDFDYVYIAKDNVEAIDMLDAFHKLYLKGKVLHKLACHEAVLAIPNFETKKDPGKKTAKKKSTKKVVKRVSVKKMPAKTKMVKAIVLKKTSKKVMKKVVVKKPTVKPSKVKAVALKKSTNKVSKKPTKKNVKTTAKKK